jgi:hypothetical protein
LTKVASAWSSGSMPCRSAPQATVGKVGTRPVCKTISEIVEAEDERRQERSERRREGEGVAHERHPSST